MKFSVLLYDALNALKRNKKRSILTMLGIIIGIGAVIAIISLGNGFQNYVMENLTEDGEDSLSIAISFIPKNSNMYDDPNISFYSNQDLTDIKAISGVKDAKVAGENYSTTTRSLEIESAQASEKYLVELVDKSDLDIVEGRNINSLDSELKKKVAVISEDVVKSLFDDYNKVIGSSIVVEGMSYRIIGVSSSGYGEMAFSGFNSEILIPQKTYSSYARENNNSPAVQVYLESGVNVKETANKVVDKLKTSGSMKDLGNYQYFDISEMLEGISKVLNQVTLFIALIGGISLFIAGIGMMNMMFISVSERTKEIGIRRAIGATKSNITLQFLLEGIMVTVIGGIFGYFFGLIFAMVISLFLPFKAAIDVGPIIISLAISLAIGITFSYAPAKSAANKNVIEILS